MSETNKSYRIRTIVGTDNKDYTPNLRILIDQDYDTFDIMSLKISSTDSYRLHNSNYGVVAGRVIANNGFGIPNAKISIFIEADGNDNIEIQDVYPYASIANQNKDGYRYNLLPDNKVSDCHQVVGSFPNKTYLLDNDILLEVFDKYYKFTTRTNNSGDYIICGVPTGTHTLHMDLDLSDCGILSQRPRDFVYKGYTIEQFENPNQFKTSTNLNSLSQIFSQDQIITVNPFWGNSELGETIGITRADINIAFKFEPTCVFMGSVVSDNSSNGISKNCVPTNQMGQMDEMVTGEGTIEMIRKTPGGGVESFQIKGGQVINADGIWCYQIPMNLDYMMTDEYGNMVPTDDPEKGIPTRARVRFRISMQDMEGNTDMYYRAKVLVPHNPQNTEYGHEEYDYDFGTYTNEESFRDLFWNNVYTVKSYIPRFSKSTRWKSEKFTGIKGCNYYGQNNPIPYNNIRIRLPLMFTILCVLIKSYIWIMGFVNRLTNFLARALTGLANLIWRLRPNSIRDYVREARYNILTDGLCPDLENWYFCPVKGNPNDQFKLKLGGPDEDVNIFNNTFADLLSGNLDLEDNTSIDFNNRIDEKYCLTKNIDYLINCIEMNLAQEYRVINFDFYNDWLNGVIYIPRWMRYIKTKRQYFLFGHKIEKVKGCMSDPLIFGKSRKYMQLCTLAYNERVNNNAQTYTRIEKNTNNNFHKNEGKSYIKIFGKLNGGIVHEGKTLVGQNVYYLKPCEWDNNTANAKKITLFATDIVLLGSLNDCDINGTPNIFEYLSSSTYKLPTNLALTNMDTDGLLYGNTDGTICNNSTSNCQVESVDNNSLKSEINYYNANEINPKNVPEPMEYGQDGQGLEESDTIAITEAAGISWDYNGPYQGETNKGGIYYPGGHFLGLSCTNSETNIKSCVNLSRICELGVTMSQRKEIVRKIESDYDGNNVLYRYKYNIPTGLVSGDEIVSVDARSIFATMNSNRLIATKTNPQTGYKYYDFNFLYPNRFNGEMENIVNSYSEYNTKVTVNDEDLTAYGILPSSARTDFIPAEEDASKSEEVYNSQRRTIETNSLDYYMFRMGLPYKYIKSGNNQIMRQRKYLLIDGSTAKLPQYDNSFYFYFGLRNGATALDEFNKEFFSVCDSETIVKQVSDVRIKTERDICNGGATVNIQIDGLIAPYTINIYVKKNNGWSKFIEESDYAKNEYTCFLEYGTYKIELSDNEGDFVSKNFIIENNVASANINSYNFNNSTDINENQEWYYGGYFTIQDLMIGDELVNGADSNFENISILIGDYNPETYVNKKKYFVKSSGTYEISVKYTCKSTGKSFVSYLGTYIIENTSKLSLTLGGDREIEIVGNNYPSSYTMDNIKWYDKSWYKEFETALGNQSELAWLLKHLTFEQKGVTEKSIAFNSNVSSNVNKGLFGWAQDLEKGWIIDKLWSSYDSNNGLITEGMLTDSSQYSKVITSADTVEFFGAMAYSSKDVGGDFFGIISGATDEYADMSDMKIVSTEIYNSMKGVGAILKSEYGEVELAKILDDGRVQFNEPKESYYGIMYPLFRYPSVYRPFYCEVYFFEYIIKELDKNIASGFETIGLLLKNEDCKIEGSIYNGITFNGKFGEKSFINGQNVNDIINIATNDTDNIDSSYRKTDFSIVGKVEDGYEYSIFEGTPEKFATSAIVVSNAITNEGIFYDDISHIMASDGVQFNIVGESSYDAKYYIIKNDRRIYGIKNEAIVYANSQEDGYVLAHYKDGVKSGESFLIRVLQNKISFYEYTSYGNSKLTEINIDASINLYDESDTYRIINNTIGDRVIIDRQITMNTNSASAKWKDIIISQIENGSAIEVQFSPNNYYNFNEDTDTLIGIYTEEDDSTLSTNSLIRLYPYA